MQSIDTQLCSYTCTYRVHTLTLLLMASLQVFLTFQILVAFYSSVLGANRVVISKFLTANCFC